MTKLNNMIRVLSEEKACHQESAASKQKEPRNCEGVPTPRGPLEPAGVKRAGLEREGD